MDDNLIIQGQMVNTELASSSSQPGSNSESGNLIRQNDQLPEFLQPQLKRRCQQKRETHSTKPSDFRQNVPLNSIFLERSKSIKELMEEDGWKSKAEQEIHRNVVAQSTLDGRKVAFNHWSDFRVCQGLNPNVIEKPPTPEEVVVFMGLLRASYPQSALTYAANWRAYVEDQLRSTLSGRVEYEYRKALPALESAKGDRHKDAPFTPAIFVELCKKAQTEEEKLVLRMCIFAFFLIMRLDEFGSLQTRIEDIPQGAKFQEVDSITEDQKQKKWKLELKKLREKKMEFENVCQVVEEQEVQQKYKNRLADKEKQIRRVCIHRSKTNIGNAGITSVFTCSCKWSKSLGVKRGFTLCPVHVMDEEDFLLAKQLPDARKRECLDSIFSRVGIKNKPDKIGGRRLYNLHSSRRGGAKCAIYSIGCNGVITLGRWSHGSGTAMEEYIQDAMCDPILGPIPVWPLLVNSIKLSAT